jgi:hypothetical protein
MQQDTARFNETDTEYKKSTRTRDAFPAAGAIDGTNN